MLGAAVLLAAAVGCGGPSASSLSGKVRLDGQPVRHALVVVIGPDGKQGVGTTDEAGVYVVMNPPRGKCQVTVAPSLPVQNPALAQGVKVPPPADGGAVSTPVPARYASPGNGLDVEVSGDRQIYDITLTP